METMLLSFYTLLGRLYYPPQLCPHFFKKGKKKKLGFSLNSFSVPGLISCVRVNVFCSVFCFCCCFLLLGFICSPLVPYFTAHWCRKKQKQKKLKNLKRKKKEEEPRHATFTLRTVAFPDG